MLAGTLCGVKMGLSLILNKPSMLVHDAAEVVLGRDLVNDSMNVFGIHAGILSYKIRNALHQMRLQVRAAPRIHEHFEKYKVRIAVGVRAAVLGGAFVQDDMADDLIELQYLVDGLTGAFQKGGLGAFVHDVGHVHDDVRHGLDPFFFRGHQPLARSVQSVRSVHHLQWFKTVCNEQLAEDAFDEFLQFA